MRLCKLISSYRVHYFTGLFQIEILNPIALLLPHNFKLVYYLQLSYRGREIHYSARGRIHSWQELWVFDGRAWDLESGISTEARHYNSSHEAIQHAVQKLMDKLENDGLLRE